MLQFRFCFVTKTLNFNFFKLRVQTIIREKNFKPRS